MPVEMKVTMKSYGLMVRKEGVRQRRINEWFRLALVKAGVYWIENFLPLHFTQRATQRYGYSARTRAWNRLKRIAAERGVWRDRQGRQFVPASPPVPLVWTRALSEELLLRRPDQFGDPSRWAKATMNRQRVVIPIKHDSHRLQKEHSDELRKVANAERRILNQVMVTEFLRLARTGGNDAPVTETIAA